MRLGRHCRAPPLARLARALLLVETPGDCRRACRDAASLEALLPCPGRRDILNDRIVTKAVTEKTVTNLNLNFKFLFNVKFGS